MFSSFRLQASWTECQDILHIPFVISFGCSNVRAAQAKNKKIKEEQQFQTEWRENVEENVHTSNIYNDLEDGRWNKRKVYKMKKKGKNSIKLRECEIWLRKGRQEKKNWKKTIACQKKL